MSEVVRNATKFITPHMPMHSSASAVLTNISPQQEPAPRKSRKSVAFSGDDTMMDENGAISEAAPTDDSKTTAMKHTTSQEDPAVDEVTDMFAGMGKKKKKSSKTKSGDDTTSTAVDGEEQTATGDFDATKKKKKKSTKPKPTESTDDTAIDSFEAKLAEAGIEDPSADGVTEPDSQRSTTSTTTPQSGDPETGTGIWSHASSTPISYQLLLSRFYHQLNQYNPDILSSSSRSYKVPPPQCLREGNKKTIFANIAEICKRMNRNDEHVTQFLFAELGTSGSVDGSKRLVIKGRFQQKQIENVLRRYIVEYVTCKTCRSPNTELSKGENRLYFVTCNSCGSRRSVTAIKSGFTAQVGKRKRLLG